MIYIVLPAYNEEEALANLLPRMRQVMDRQRVDYQILVVDDGSQDRTAEVAKASGADRILPHAQNRGLAAGLRTGLGFAGQIAQAEDVIVTMDADNTHNPALIARMLQRIDEGFDVIIASRYQPGARVIGVPASREMVSYIGGWIYRLLLPIPGVKDYTCGYRAYRARVLKEAFERWGDGFISESGFSAMTDILLKLRSIKGVLMTELPFILRYDQKPGLSKMKVGSNILASLRLALRRALGKFD
jgi:dolichol-phosphate mannosyltransferase